MDTSGILAFLNNAAVKEDMHADKSAQWDLCDLDLMERFKRDPTGSYHIYAQLLREERDLRIVIFIKILVDCIRHPECFCAYFRNKKMG